MFEMKGFNMNLPVTTEIWMAIVGMLILVLSIIIGIFLLPIALIEAVVWKIIHRISGDKSNEKSSTSPEAEDESPPK